MIFQVNGCCWKIFLVDTAWHRLVPSRQHRRDWEMDFLWDFPWPLAKFVCFTAQYSLFAWFEEVLSSYGTRHHTLPFSNRCARWLNFCKDPGFHPKLNGANGIFFLLNELWISSSTFQFRTVIPWLFLLWLLAKLFNSFRLIKFRLHCHSFQYYTKDWLALLLWTHFQ